MSPEGVMMSRDQLSVMALQIPCVMGQSPDVVIEEMGRHVARAAARGADLVLFPELWALELADPNVAPGPEVHRVAAAHTPHFFAAVKKAARESEIAVLAGSAPFIEDGALFNTAILALSDGRFWLQHKLFPTPEEREWGMVGGSTIKVINAPWGLTCILICYDAEFPSVSAALAPLEPEVLLIPSMTNADGLHRVRWAAKARVVEHHAYAVVAGVVESEVYGEVYCGQVSALTPRQPGFPGLLAKGPHDEPASLLVDLDLKKLRQSRKSAGMYPARDEVRRSKGIHVKSVP